MPHLRHGRLQPYIRSLQSRTSAFLKPLGCCLHRERFVDYRSSGAPLRYGTSDCVSLHQDPSWLELGQPIGRTGDQHLRRWRFSQSPPLPSQSRQCPSGRFILSSTIRRRPCTAVLASLRNQQSIAFLNVSPELKGSMFTDRQKLHPERLVTSDSSEESFFQSNSPNQLKSGGTRVRLVAALSS